MSQKSQVLVVDDDLAMCGFLRSFLGARNYNALTVTNADEAVRRFHAERPAAVLLDVVMPGSMDGLAALAAFKKIDKDVPIIVISGQGRTSVVVQAMRLGATDFLCKPFEENELEVVIEKALKQHQLSQEVATLRAQLKEQSRYTMLFGHSRQMHEVRDLIERVSDTDVTVLIRGESGVGKELVARAIHQRSTRKNKPFVKVNCAALPAELLESELFGHERGAFTGAANTRIGKFEQADTGTLMLDEIGEMKPALQAKLLHVLQDGEFTKLGSNKRVQVDVRVVAATNRDLEKMMLSGEFREDLYYRLKVIELTVPPLRERRDEIPTLIDFFIARYARKYNRQARPLSEHLRQLFMTYDWPGNIRELENMIKRVVILQDEQLVVREIERNMQRALAAAVPVAAVAGAVATAGVAGPGGYPSMPSIPYPPSMPPPQAVPADADAAYDDAVAGDEPAEAGGGSLATVAKAAAMKAERAAIEQTLRQVHWNRRKAAQILGVSYKTLLNKIKECGISRV